jgi:hypothetical protein
VQLPQAQGKTHVEIAVITGYTRTYESTMLKQLAREPKMLESISREGRPHGGVRSDESRHCGYAPPGQTSIVRIPARCRSLSNITAATNQGKVRFMIYPGGSNPQRLIVVMRRLKRYAERQVYLILDNLNVHKAKPMREWLAEQVDQIEVFCLPPYSPELNPSEYFNGDPNGEMQRGILPKDVTDLKRTALAHSRHIQRSAAPLRGHLRNRHILCAA